MGNGPITEQATVRVRELELALARIEQMSRPIDGTGQLSGRTVRTMGRVEMGSLAEAARIAREALAG